MTAAKDEKNGSSKQMLRFQCHVIDCVMNLFVFFPSMLCYWRGVWDLYTYYFSSINPDEGVYNWFIAATGACFVLAYFVYPIVNRLIANLPVIIRAVLVRLTLYCGGILAMGYWRGVWGLLDHYIKQNWEGAAIGLAISYPTLVLLNASRSIIFPPFVACMDSRVDALIPGTRFQSRLRPGLKSLIKYSLDSLFTHFILLTLTILNWRSMLTLLYLIPFPEGLGDFICFGVGMFSVVIIFMLEIPFALMGRCLVSGTRWTSETILETQPSESVSAFGSRDRAIRRTSGPCEMVRNMFRFSAKRKALLKLRIYENLVFLLIFCCEAFLWLGAWNLNSTYIVPDKKVGGWINHAFGSFLLIILGLMTFGGYCGCGSDDSILGSLLEFTSQDSLYLYPNRYIRSIVEDAEETSDSSGGMTSSSSESPLSILAPPTPLSSGIDSNFFPGHV